MALKTLLDKDMVKFDDVFKEKENILDEVSKGKISDEIKN
jgi:hypothetical protein